MWAQCAGQPAGIGGGVEIFAPSAAQQLPGCPARANLSAPVRHEMETLLQFFFTYLLERGLNSPQFIRDVLKTDRESSKQVRSSGTH